VIDHTKYDEKSAESILDTAVHHTAGETANCKVSHDRQELLSQACRIYRATLLLKCPKFDPALPGDQNVRMAESMVTGQVIKLITHYCNRKGFDPRRELSYESSRSVPKFEIVWINVMLTLIL